MFDLSLLGPENLRPLKRVEYDRLVEMGAFEDEKVELLYGMLVRKSPQGPPHAESVRLLTRLLERALGDRAAIFSHSPFSAVSESKPEPDIAVVPPGDYSKAHPNRAYLIVEAADSSLRTDRALKAPLYAVSGVTEYWILDLPAGCIEVHRDPSPAGFRSVERFGREARLPLEAFPDVVVEAFRILPID